MALKAILESLEGLNEAVAGEYKKGDDGKYHLDVDGLDEHPGVGALKRAKEHEKTARQKAADEAKAAREELDTLREQIDDMRRGNIPKGDVEALEKSWADKVAKLEQKYTGETQGLRGTLETLLVDNVAQSLASKISTAPELIMPHIKARLRAEYGEEGAVTKVVDAKGQPTALSIDELQAEFIANEAFAPIIKGSEASGGGAAGAGKIGGGASSNFDTRKAKPNEFAARIKARKQRG